jgi:hypothetical protein
MRLERTLQRLRSLNPDIAILSEVACQFSPWDVNCHAPLPRGSPNGEENTTPGRAALRDFETGLCQLGGHNRVRVQGELMFSGPEIRRSKAASLRSCQLGFNR